MAVARYGTVEQKVRQVVASLGDDVHYMFKNWAQANEEIDRLVGPTVIFVLPPSGTLDMHYSMVRDYPECQIAFVTSTDFDFEGAENDNLVEQMKRLCVRFLVALNHSGLFELVEGAVPYRVLYDTFDENVTGIAITLTLQEEEGIIACANQYRSTDEEESEEEETEDDESEEG